MIPIFPSFPFDHLNARFLSLLLTNPQVDQGFQSIWLKHVHAGASCVRLSKFYDFICSQSGDCRSVLCRGELMIRGQPGQSNEGMNKID